MSTPLLTMRDISIAFWGVQALEGVELTLRAGEIHALMGENGAGKSTLIKVLTGVHLMDAGQIQIAGHHLCPRSPRQAESAGISTVYQEINLISALSVADNICLGRQPKRFGCIQWKAVRARAQRALGRLGLDLDVGRPVGSYSIAVQQLVAIARALDIKAKLVILDEPTSSLDEREVKFLFKIMRQLRDEGLAILFVTHFLDQVYSISDRITVLRNGKFVGEFETEKLPRLKLINAMLGRAFDEIAQIRGPSSIGERAAAFLRARQIGKRGSIAPIDLEVAAGETVGLAGLLGSGRTETVKMLFGITPADSGELQIDGKPVTIGSPRQAIALGLAYCSEDRKSEGIIPQLSVRENLILAMQAKRGAFRMFSRQEQSTVCDHYIRSLNIRTPNAETPIQNLSGGNQQKVLLARWLSIQPKLILLDEPTRGIDVGAKAEIEKLIESLRTRGMAILFISSEIEEIVRLSQRVIVLRDRKKAGELAGAEVQEDKILHVIAHHNG